MPPTPPLSVPIIHDFYLHVPQAKILLLKKCIYGDTVSIKRCDCAKNAWIRRNNEKAMNKMKNILAIVTPFIHRDIPVSKSIDNIVGFIHMTRFIDKVSNESLRPLKTKSRHHNQCSMSHSLHYMCKNNSFGHHGGHIGFKGLNDWWYCFCNIDELLGHEIANTIMNILCHLVLILMENYNFRPHGSHLGIILLIL